MKTCWHIDSFYQGGKWEKQWQSFDELWHLKGEQITSSPISDLYKVVVSEETLYLKRYWRAGKYLRRFLGTSRIKKEWQNLHFFQSLGILTPPIVLFVEQKKGFQFHRAMLITKSLDDTADLSTLYLSDAPQLKDSNWCKSLIHRVAEYTRKLHQHNFVHNDLKWRNILVTLNTEHPQIFLLDCPAGQKIWGPLLKRGQIKDLACLDKVAKKCLTNTQRLNFYKEYRQINKLSPQDKKAIRKVIQFFKK